MVNYTQKYGVALLLMAGLLFWPTSIPCSMATGWGRLSGDGLLTLFNTHLNEWATVTYRTKEGNIDPKAIEEIRYVLRCRLTNDVAPMSVELIALVDHIQDHFHATEVDVISGYRSPSLNESLRKGGHKVAKRSLHMKGEAMDIRLPHVATRELFNYAWSLQQGGVGFYPSNGFVHVDVGPIRRW